MDPDRLRALYTRHTAVHALLNDRAVVPLDAMLAVLEHRGTEEERRETLNRILADPESRREFDLLRAAIRASDPAQVPPPPDSAETGPRD
ncbi:MAG TPA: hypothetical protein VG692_03405 [Gemmatimonadales bacterium]|nr:hypothetical protein [Gemmatimonadales bacterium]